MRLFSDIQRRLSRDELRFFREWLGVTLSAIFLLAALLWSQLIVSLGYLAYDQMRRLQPERSSPEIVLIAVDDASLDRLGGWPLRRAYYATLLQRLAMSESMPRAVGFDILFYDPSPDDAAFAAQLRRHRAFLAMESPFSENGELIGGHFPVPVLRQAATGLAHIAASYESDGFMRGAELSRGGMPHLALAVSGKPMPSTAQPNQYWRFNLVDPALGFQTFSLADVLDGQVSPGVFKDKYVLIGATAPSLGDHHPTIYSGREATGMPGVELHANLLNGILKESLVSTPSLTVQFAVSIVAILVVASGMYFLSPLAELTLAIMVVLALVFLAFGLLETRRLWFDPSPACVVIALLKPAWAWRRADMIIGFLKERAASIESLANGPHEKWIGHFRGDTVLRYSGLLDRAIHVVSESVRLLGEILSKSPNATLVADYRGDILLSNDRMVLSMPPGLTGQGKPLRPLLDHLGFSPLQQFEALAGEARPVVVEREHGDDFYQFHAATLPLGGGHEPLLLISLVDVTEIRRSQAQRDRALQFLSHDMRTPVAAILALNGLEAGQDEKRRAGIRRNADKLLQLMDEFILSIRAEESSYRLTEAMFETVVDDAVFQVKELVRLREMRIDIETDGDVPFVLVEARLMTRVFVNLLMNALRYGQPGGTVRIRQATVSDSGADWVRCEVTNLVGDAGGGAMDSALLEGFGLGTEFIRNVIRKHGGRVSFSLPTTPGVIASVVLWLPLSISI